MVSSALYFRLLLELLVWLFSMSTGILNSVKTHFNPLCASSLSMGKTYTMPAAPCASISQNWPALTWNTTTTRVGIIHGPTCPLETASPPSSTRPWPQPPSVSSARCARAAPGCARAAPDCALSYRCSRHNFCKPLHRSSWLSSCLCYSAGNRSGQCSSDISVAFQATPPSDPESPDLIHVPQVCQCPAFPVPWPHWPSPGPRRPQLQLLVASASPVSLLATVSCLSATSTPRSVLILHLLCGIREPATCFSLCRSAFIGL